MKLYTAILLSLLFSGCVTYANVEKSTDSGKCRSVARGYWFSFSTPAALEECRPDQDR